MAIKLRRTVAFISVVFAILASSAAAQDVRVADNSAASAPAGQGPLDGMSFVGKIRPEDNRDLDDELHFAAGQFWSKNCVACGYQPGPYWSRKDGGNIHFHGALQSADGGRFDYSGRVVGGHQPFDDQHVRRAAQDRHREQSEARGERGPTQWLRSDLLKFHRVSASIDHGWGGGH